MVDEPRKLGTHTRMSEGEIQALILVYHETKSIKRAADAVGCNWTTAKQHIMARMAESSHTYGNTDHQGEIEEYRLQQERDLLDMILEGRIKLVQAISSARKIRDARMGELAQAFAILTDKAQLLMGQPTSRPEIVSTQKIEERLTPEQKSMLEDIRRKLVNDGADVGAGVAVVVDD